jgi:hypothetical protein
MTRTTEPRRISSAETAVIQAALDRAPTASPLVRLPLPLEELRVVGLCECGCDSVDFVPVESAVHSRPLADGIGTTSAGGDVGIIVWGTDDAVTGLEIYDLGAGDGDVRLPVSGSIRPFESETA